MPKNCSTFYFMFFVGIQRVFECVLGVWMCVPLGDYGRISKHEFGETLTNATKKTTMQCFPLPVMHQCREVLRVHNLFIFIGYQNDNLQ